eukprot:7916053-Pyramimonas_sp.AAC.1
MTFWSRQSARSRRGTWGWEEWGYRRGSSLSRGGGTGDLWSGSGAWALRAALHRDEDDHRQYLRA